MPDRFTKTFAERLDKRGAMAVHEVRDGDVVAPHEGFVSPGGLITRIKPGPTPGELVLTTSPPTAADRYAPSADALMESAAKHLGPRAIGVVLTGMGDDGVAGARAIRAAGGRVVAESEETAIVHGMPGSAIRAGVVDRVMPLGDIVTYLATLS
jgi:two-component system chemotaxis response regulator CheB